MFKIQHYKLGGMILNREVTRSTIDGLETELNRYVSKHSRTIVSHNDSTYEILSYEEIRSVVHMCERSLLLSVK